MPRSRDTAAHAATSEQIKAIARRQMREQGTGALSLRAIARELDVTAPALYGYFPSLDDLITALIMDAFSAHADAIDAAAAAAAPLDYRGRLRAAITAYRAWALAHPTEFELLYGNPIPGYQAPSEQTIPVATRPLILITRIFTEAYLAGMLDLPADLLTPAMDAHIRALMAGLGYAIDPRLIYLMESARTQIHGIVMLELHGHLIPSIGDVEGFVQREIDRLIASFGLRSPP